MTAAFIHKLFHFIIGTQKTKKGLTKIYREVPKTAGQAYTQLLVQEFF